MECEKCQSTENLTIIDEGSEFEHVMCIECIYEFTVDSMNKSEGTCLIAN